MCLKKDGWLLPYKKICKIRIHIVTYELNYQDKNYF
jgi:hypothetical protein